MKFDTEWIDGYWRWAPPSKSAGKPIRCSHCSKPAIFKDVQTDPPRTFYKCEDHAPPPPIPPIPPTPPGFHEQRKEKCDHILSIFHNQNCNRKEDNAQPEVYPEDE